MTENQTTMPQNVRRMHASGSQMQGQTSKKVELTIDYLFTPTRKTGAKYGPETDSARLQPINIHWGSNYTTVPGHVGCAAAGEQPTFEDVYLRFY